MNETVHNLINAIATGDALETEQAFGAAMAEKLSVKLDDMRTNIAQNMFKSQETVVEEETQIEEETSGLDNSHAKEVAKTIAKSNKNLKVSSFGNEHYVHHKADEDGNDTLKVHAEGGKIHLTRESGVMGHSTSSHDSVESAVEAGKKHV